MRGHEMSGRGIVVRIRSFIEPDLFDNDVPFNNTTPIYLIILLWKLGLGLELDLQLHYFCIFCREQRERASYLPQILRKIAKRTHPNDEQHYNIEYVIYFILLFIACVRFFSKMLPYVKFVEDKMLVFVILREKCENSTTVSLTLILTLISIAD